MIHKYVIEIRLQNERSSGYFLRIGDDSIEYWDDFNGKKKRIESKDPQKLTEIQDLLNFAYHNAVRIIEESTEIKKNRKGNLRSN